MAAVARVGPDGGGQLRASVGCALWARGMREVIVAGVGRQGGEVMGAAVRGGAWHVECVRLLLAASGPLCEIGGLLEPVFERGQAEVAAVLIEQAPRLLDGVNLSKCIAVALEKGQKEMAGLLSSIIEQRVILDLVPNRPASADPILNGDQNQKLAGRSSDSIGWTLAMALRALKALVGVVPRRQERQA